MFGAIQKRLLGRQYEVVMQVLMRNEPLGALANNHCLPVEFPNMLLHRCTTLHDLLHNGGQALSMR